MDLVHKGKVAAYRRIHAQILLFTDEGEMGPGLPVTAHGRLLRIRAGLGLHGRIILHKLIKMIITGSIQVVLSRRYKSWKQ